MNIVKASRESRLVVHVIEDDEALGSALVWMLDGAGFAASYHPAAQSFLDQLDASRPCCVVTDVRMQGMDGLELQKLLASRHPVIPVILITAHGDVPMAVGAVKSGALDFIEKPFANAELLRIVRKAARQALSGFDDRRSKEAANAALRLLTPREREVFDLLASGHSNKAIADRLGIAIKTVEVHRSRVKEKVGANTLADIIELSRVAAS